MVVGQYYCDNKKPGYLARLSLSENPIADARFALRGNDRRLASARSGQLAVFGWV